MKIIGEYLDRIKLLRKDKKLFISIMKFYKRVSRDIISRWIRDIMKLVGIDVFKFSLYFIWVVVISVVYNVGVLIDIIMEKVGWLNVSIF